jgi:F0F1-type ATP synthase delta subunit
MTRDPKLTARALVEIAGEGVTGRQFLRQVREELTRQLKLMDKTLFVEITTPTGDSGELRESVKKYLEEKLDRTVEMKDKADATLIGGAQITFGDQQIDVSVRSGLEQAAAAFLKTA